VQKVESFVARWFMTSGIYAIINMVNGKQYVGSAVDIRRRWLVHRWELRRGTHHSGILQRAWVKYGEHGFAFEVLEELADSQALVPAEQRWIDALKPAYNVAPTAGSQLGFKHAAETLPRLGASWKGRKHTPEERAKIGSAHRGKLVSAETRAKLSVAKKGQRKGIGWTEERRAQQLVTMSTPEYRAKMSAALQGRPHSPDCVAKVAEANRGRPMSEQARANMRAAWNNPEVREKRVAAMREAHSTPEVHAKRSEAARRGWVKRYQREGKDTEVTQEPSL